MSRTKRWSLGRLALIMMILMSVGISVNAADRSLTKDVQETEVSVMAAPVSETLDWQADMPVLSKEQEESLAAWAEKTHLPGPLIEGKEEGLDVAAPVAGSETNPIMEDKQNAPGPLAPGDAQIYRNVTFGSGFPGGSRSNVMESSVAENGKNVFYTGNWFAARSTNGGQGWTYINPAASISDFCCDQVTLHDESRNMLLWYRQGSPNSSGVNRFRLGVSTDGGANFCAYDVYPTGVNSEWTNQWWDYPHLQLGADYLYIASNMFSASSQWVRTALLRFPLDNLRACSGFNFNYLTTTNWFTWVPVQGADHAMYFASNWPISAPYNRISVWRWYEDQTSTTSTMYTAPSWSRTGRNQAVCGSTNANWAARTDDRLLTGARYMLHNSNYKEPGRMVLGWWWNVKQGGGFGQPYIDGFTIYENNLSVLSGAQGRPYLWNPSVCFLYPSAAANKRGDLALVFNASTGSNMNPSVAYAIADDYTAVPPGFTYYTVQASNARPSDNVWGDYNTVRAFLPTQDTWVGAGHTIQSGSNCTYCALPVLFNFGRARDFPSWNGWQDAAPPPGWTTIVEANFEGGFPGAWSVFDGLSGYGEYYWAKRGCLAYTGSYGGWAVGGGSDGGALGCGSYYANNTRSWMTYGPFSLVGATAADMSYKLWLYAESGFDYVCRLASIDGSNWYGNCTSGSSNGWINQTLNLANVYSIGDLRGRPQVWVALFFYTDSSVTFAEGAYVDNVLVRKCMVANCGTLGEETLSPASQLIEVPFATTVADLDKAPTYEGRPPKAVTN